MGGSYTDEGFKEFLKKHAGEGSNSEMLRFREQIEKTLHILPMKEYKGEPVYKIVIISQTLEQIQRARSAMTDEFQFCIQEENKGGYINGEILSRDYDKGRALEKVCEHLGIPLADSVAFGDSMNDIEMIAAAGLGICMENGSRTLKEKADDICPSVRDGGIRKAFLKYGLAAEKAAGF